MTKERKMRKKPDYKKALKGLMRILDEEDNKNISNKNKIKDVTKKSLGTVYQFTGFRKDEEE